MATDFHQAFVAVGGGDEDLKPSGDAADGIVISDGAVRQQIAEMGEGVGDPAEGSVGISVVGDDEKVEIGDVGEREGVVSLLSGEVLLDRFEPVSDDHLAGALTHQAVGLVAIAVVSHLGERLFVETIGGDPKAVEEPASGAGSGHAEVGQHLFQSDGVFSEPGEHALSF